jgi:steroid 5-alpha reductase family enzyme
MHRIRTLIRFRQVFNITFICLYQHLLLLLIVLPSHAAQRSTAPLGALDAAATALFLSLVLLETVADQQQWRFQQSKRNLLPRQCVRIRAREARHLELHVLSSDAPRAADRSWLLTTSAAF